MQPQGAQVVVTVHDDGIGFEPATLGHGGHGLAGMRQRIEALGGQWQVQSTPGQGTTVHAWLPPSG